ncbi:MAG: M23 family metallopeptidase [Anaeromicrobium sp.]|jgi:murein DD-endopeptidase MepM/ murein hydrolase activator NlpD|uniref:M23 family metallopeptidase n=1 Tax=Anaeromicrobium sp. TaxID=1929132 RepID=UPI0025E4F5E1|nr:M23 family metallopeptidase [Anaeromicrobium sp.]MCT4593940.1 M23 family metallopeptidase [Anaeromicrobium sp.]
MKNKNSIYKLLEKKSFYIALFLGVFILATSAVWVNKNKVEDDKIGEDYFNNGNVAQNGEDIDEPIIFIEDQMEELRAEMKEQRQVPKKVHKTKDPTKTLVSRKTRTIKKDEEVPVLKIDETEAVPSSTLANMNMIKPLEGTVGMNYAEDTLTYSKTLDQYTTHKGIDIEAELNTPVVSVLDGEIIEVITDSRLGITISIAHANGLITKYANLSTTEMVSVGDVVEQGQTISGVGKTALFEISEKPHLHFEVLLDGKNVDPEKFMK